MITSFIGLTNPLNRIIDMNRGEENVLSLF